MALCDLARATDALAAYLETPDQPDGVRRYALEAAGGATALLREHEDLAKDLATNAFIDVVHSAAVDLLGSTGMNRAEALQALAESTHRPSESDWLAYSGLR